MTLYLLSVHGSTDAPPPSAEYMEKAFPQVDAFNKKLQEKGNWVFAGGLHPIDTATTVTVKDDGEVLVTDGPFVESKEFLGGFWVVKAADLDEALALAAEGSVACMNPVEVRPFQDDTEGL